MSTLLAAPTALRPFEVIESVQAGSDPVELAQYVHSRSIPTIVRGVVRVERILVAQGSTSGVGMDFERLLVLLRCLAPRLASGQDGCALLTALRGDPQGRAGQAVLHELHKGGDALVWTRHALMFEASIQERLLRAEEMHQMMEAPRVHEEALAAAIGGPNARRAARAAISGGAVREEHRDLYILARNEAKAYARAEHRVRRKLDLANAHIPTGSFDPDLWRTIQVQAMEEIEGWLRTGADVARLRHATHRLDTQFADRVRRVAQGAAAVCAGDNVVVLEFWR